MMWFGKNWFWFGITGAAGDPPAHGSASNRHQVAELFSDPEVRTLKELLGYMTGMPSRCCAQSMALWKGKGTFLERQGDVLKSLTNQHISPL